MNDGEERLQGDSGEGHNPGGVPGRNLDMVMSVEAGYGLVRGRLGLDGGVRIGTYRGTSDGFLLLPYAKVGLFQDRSTRAALSVDFAGLPQVPYFVSIIIDHRAGPWTPYFAAKRFISHGIAGDDPYVTRFQKRDQAIWAFAGGFERSLGPELSILFEAGVMIDRHDIDEWHESEAVNLVNPLFGIGLRL